MNQLINDRPAKFNFRFIFVIPNFQNIRSRSMKKVIVVIGAGSIGQAIARRVGALLMGEDGGFIRGSDFLMDGGVTAAYWYGELAQ